MTTLESKLKQLIKGTKESLKHWDDHVVDSLQCRRDGVPSLLGLMVLFFAKGTPVQLQQVYCSAPHGLHKYIFKLNSWLSGRVAIVDIRRQHCHPLLAVYMDKVNASVLNDDSDYANFRLLPKSKDFIAQVQ